MLRRLVVLMVLLAVAGMASGFMLVRTRLAGSLPDVSGRVAVEGLAGEVQVARDGLGIPVISGDSLEDVVFAQGFVHAQDRFFQMDGLRRYAAGRLSEVLGSYTLGLDLEMRPYGFREVAGEVVERIPKVHRQLLEAYSHGVNAGLQELEATPPEYLVSGTEPESWSAEDCVLVTLAMQSMLATGAREELMRAVMNDALPEEVVAFLTPSTTRFDAPMDVRDEAWRPAPIPGPEVWRLSASGASDAGETLDPAMPAGSNNFAVAGSKTADGRAILANDMHLGLRIPNTWYRVELRWGEGELVGASLAGVPGIVVGSNTHLAWGFTNSMGDFQDYVVVEVDSADSESYLTPDGLEPFGKRTEVILVAGEEPVSLEVQETRWGNVVGEDHRGRPLVMKWAALDPDRINLALFDLFSAKSVDEGVAIVRRWYGPNQNVLLADRGGRIGYVLSGFVPQRRGFRGDVPVSWAGGKNSWAGGIDEAHRPAIVDPETGFLFTANSRPVAKPDAELIGRNWSHGVRARRISELLESERQFHEQDLLAVQLDVRSEVMDFYRTLLLETIDTMDSSEVLMTVRRHVQAWDGYASADSIGYRLIRTFGLTTHDALTQTWFMPCRELDDGFRFHWFQQEEVLRRVLEERPSHLVPPGFDDWDLFLQSMVSQFIVELEDGPREEGVLAPWGHVNRAKIGHPMADALGLAKGMLMMPEHMQSGDHWTVRVSMPSYGATERLVVSPGREEDGIFHMPGGQSGHPLSRHYRDGHAAWAEGRASPLLAGPSSRVLTLEPIQ